MGILLASLAQLGFKEESSWNETPTATQQTHSFGILRDAVEFPDPVRMYDYYRTIGSLSRIPNCLDRNEVEFVGTIPFTLRNGKALVFGLGKSVRTGSDPYTHTIQTDSDLASFVAEAVIGDGVNDYLRYATGCKVNRMTIEGTEKGVIKTSLEVLAGKTYKSANAKSTVESLTCAPYQYHHTSTNLNLWTTGFARVKSWSFTIDNHLEPAYYWQDTDADYPYEILEFEQTVEMKARIIPTDLDLFDHIGTETEFDVNLVVTRGTNDSIQFKSTGTDCVLRSAPHPLPEKGVLEVDVDILMPSFQIVVVDSISSYPNETT